MQDLGFSKNQTIIDTNFDKNKDAFKQSLTSIRGILSSTYSSSIPGGNNDSAYSAVQNKAGDMQKANIDLYFVDYDYIPQYQLKMSAGRSFSRDFATDSMQAMIINESAARMLTSGNECSIQTGQRVRVYEGKEELVVTRKSNNIIVFKTLKGKRMMSA
ncbi:MAG: hypothetical protein ABIN89_28695 [Chitinophagaceae bacterium]